MVVSLSNPFIIIIIIIIVIITIIIIINIYGWSGYTLYVFNKANCCLMSDEILNLTECL